MPDDCAGSDKEQIAGRVGFQAEYVDAFRLAACLVFLLGVCFLFFLAALSLAFCSAGCFGDICRQLFAQSFRVHWNIACSYIRIGKGCAGFFD